MVPYRRAAGVAAAFLMLQLVLASRGFLCPQHDRATASSAEVSAATEPGGALEHAHHDSDQPSSPDQHHPLPDRCPAMNTCSSGVALRSADNLLTTGISPLSAPVHVATLLHSRVEPPDPPPPKA